MSEADGSGSIKRVVLLILILLFVGMYVFHHVTKIPPFTTLETDLKDIIMLHVTLISGNRVADQIASVKKVESNNSSQTPAA